MTHLLLVFLCIVIGCLSDPECGADQDLVSCPKDCVTDYCPRSEEESLQTCPRLQTDICRPKECKCRINYRYASPTNKTCIPTRDCPPFECCQPNQEFNSCPLYCPSDTCSEATPDGSCPVDLGYNKMLLICSPKCLCIKGYWKEDGVCIPYAECPEKTPDDST